MTKLAKESVLPLASALLGGNAYTEGLKQAMESFDWSEDNYYRSSTPVNKTLTKKQKKSRAKSKAAKKARKRK